MLDDRTHLVYSLIERSTRVADVERRAHRARLEVSRVQFQRAVPRRCRAIRIELDARGHERARRESGGQVGVMRLPGAREVWKPRLV